MQFRKHSSPPPFNATVMGLTLEEGRTLTQSGAMDAIRAGFKQTAMLPIMARDIQGYKKPQSCRSAVLVQSEYHIELLRNVWTVAFNDSRLDVHAQNYVEHPDVICYFSETAAAAGVLKDGTCSIQYVASNSNRKSMSRGWAKGAVCSVMAHAAKAGCDLAVLQTTSQGYPLYRRLGFSEITRYHQFAGLV
jgi:hypothetical protein